MRPEITIASVHVGPEIVLRNHSRIVGIEEAWRVAAALSLQANEQLARPAPHGWGVGVRRLRVETIEEPARPDEWHLLLVDSVGDAGALGWHEHTETGHPSMIVFPNLDRQDGVPWSTAASHELLETLVDPNLSLSGVGGDDVVRAVEVCDPVEEDWYDLNGVLVSNFVLPSWFQPIDAPAKFDCQGRLGSAGELSAGGWCYIFRDGEWYDTGARKRASRQARDELGTGRGATRKRIRQEQKKRQR